MSYLEQNYEELREEADVREKDIAEGWDSIMTEKQQIEERDLLDLHQYEANKVDPKD